MKKLLALFLAALLVFSLAACANNQKPVDDKNDGQNVTDNNDKNDQNDNKDDENKDDENKDDENKGDASANGALDLLNTVWNSYGEDEKFPVAGGDMSEENMNMEGPGKFSVEDGAALDATLGYPEASADKIDDAASLVHMMNANIFTCGVYHAANAGSASEVADAVKENIAGRQWICGFPDKMVIATLDDYVIAIFGENETVDTFKDKLTAALPAVEVVVDEPIA